MAETENKDFNTTMKIFINTISESLSCRTLLNCYLSCIHELSQKDKLTHEEFNIIYINYNNLLVRLIDQYVRHCNKSYDHKISRVRVKCNIVTMFTDLLVKRNIVMGLWKLRENIMETFKDGWLETIINKFEADDSTVLEDIKKVLLIIADVWYTYGGYNYYFACCLKEYSEYEKYQVNKDIETNNTCSRTDTKKRSREESENNTNNAKKQC